MSSQIFFLERIFVFIFGHTPGIQFGVLLQGISIERFARVEMSCTWLHATGILGSVADMVAAVESEHDCQGFWKYGRELGWWW